MTFVGRAQVEYPSGWTCQVTVVRLERYVVESLPRLFGQYLVHRGDRDRALAHGRGDPLRAAAADIPDREHAGNAGFE